MVNFEKTQSEEIQKALDKEKLKKSGTYRIQLVKDQLYKDFHNKCYICEQKAPTSINIEHFIPHKGGKNRDLEFDWNNLFNVCGYCNNTKLAKEKYDNILNCTNSTHKVSEWIFYELKPYPKEKVTIESIHALSDNPDIIKNTVSLLEEVYNKEGQGAENLRNLILKELIEFQRLLNEYFYEDLDAEEKEICENKIHRHLKISSAFCAFKRWIIKNNAVLANIFQF